MSAPSQTPQSPDHYSTGALDVTSSAIHHYISLGILHPAGAPRPKLFLREEVESLIPPQKLSIPQAAALLELSVSELYALIQAGQIPIVRFAQCPEKRWLLYSDVERLRDRAEK